ncbi:MAG: class I tRNA ligase family protein, partial [Candidatus Thorarchaeota archaeon]
LQILHDFTWKKLCDNYLESVKPYFGIDDQIRSATVKRILKEILWKILRMLAPFIPHITEAIYLNMFKEEIGEISIHATSWPEKEKRKLDPKTAELGGKMIEIISLIRQAKATERIALNQPIKSATITTLPEDIPEIEKYKELIQSPLHVSELKFKPGQEISVEIQIE